MKLADIHRLSGGYRGPVSPEMQEQVRDLLQTLGYDPDNLYQELEMSSRFVETHQDTSYSNGLVQLHSHSFYEILYCRNTCGAEYLVGAQRYRLQRGDIIMVPPGVSHRPLLPERMTEPYNRDVLWFSTEFVEMMTRLYPERMDGKRVHGSLFRTAGTRWEFLGEVFRKGVKESERRASGWEAAVIGNTITLLTHLKRALMDHDAAAPDAESPELLDQVLGYVEAHLGEKITLSDVARHFFVSEATITLTFRKKMGTSFYRCVTQRRLIAAKTLIAQGMLLESVGEQVGFADYSTFYRAFKQEFGISPRQFRKMEEARNHPGPA